MKSCPKCNGSIPEGKETCPHCHRFRFHHASGGVRIGDILILAVIAGAGWFIDWSSITDKLSSGTSGPTKAAPTSLDCELKGGGLGPHGQGLPTKASITGSVENLAEEPLKLSVRIDYVWKGRKFQGKRIESVSPSPLAHRETGWFEFEEYTDPFPEGVQCMVQFYDNDDEQPISFEDKRS